MQCVRITRRNSVNIRAEHFSGKGNLVQRTQQLIEFVDKLIGHGECCANVFIAGVVDDAAPVCHGSSAFCFHWKLLLALGVEEMTFLGTHIAILTDPFLCVGVEAFDPSIHGVTTDVGGHAKWVQVGMELILQFH